MRLELSVFRKNTLYFLLKTYKAELSKAYQQIIFGRGPEAKTRKLPGNILVLQKDLPGVIESNSNCRLAVFKVIFEKFFLDSLVRGQGTEMLEKPFPT